MRWPWGKSYTVRCPDGTIKTVFRNLHDVFPLFVPGWQGDLTGGVGGSAAAAGIDEVKAELKGSYATKIQTLLFAIDEDARTIMLNFRGVYLTFASDPCRHSEFLQTQMQQLVAEQQRLSRLRIQTKALIELARNQPNETVRILMLFKEVAGNAGGQPAVEATVLEIAEARQIAGDWSRQS